MSQMIWFYTVNQNKTKQKQSYRPEQASAVNVARLKYSLS